MSVQIPAVPKSATVDQLTNHINDRLRRISLELGPGATGKTGATGPPGTSGSGGGGALTPRAVPVVSATATPDASKPVNVLKLTVASTALLLPINVPTDGTGLVWTLIVQQDATGGRVLTMTAYASMPYELSNAQSPATTECIQVFYSDVTGTRALYPPQMNTPIP